MTKTKSKSPDSPDYPDSTTSTSLSPHTTELLIDAGDRLVDIIDRLQVSRQPLLSRDEIDNAVADWNQLRTLYLPPPDTAITAAGDIILEHESPALPVSAPAPAPPSEPGNV